MEVQGEPSSGASKAVVGREEDTPLPVRRRCPLFEASMISASSTDSDLRGEVRESQASVVARSFLPGVAEPCSGKLRCAKFGQKVGTVRAFAVRCWSLRPTLRRRRRGP